MGRPAVYFDPACRQRAYRARRPEARERARELQHQRRERARRQLAAEAAQRLREIELEGGREALGQYLLGLQPRVLARLARAVRKAAKGNLSGLS